MDFTLIIYQQLLGSLIAKNYHFLTVEEYFTRQVDESPSHQVTLSPSRPPCHDVVPISGRSLIVLLRHDVDRRPKNSLRMAILENELGVKATYYFRTIPQTLKR